MQKCGSRSGYLAPKSGLIFSRIRFQNSSYICNHQTLKNPQNTVIIILKYLNKKKQWLSDTNSLFFPFFFIRIGSLFLLLDPDPSNILKRSYKPVCGIYNCHVSLSVCLSSYTSAMQKIQCHQHKNTQKNKKIKKIWTKINV